MADLRERLLALADEHSIVQMRAGNRAFAVAAARMALQDAMHACAGEHVDAEATGEEADRAYNMACDHCAQAIRALCPT